MQALAKLPEALTAWKLCLPLLLPAFGVAPDLHWWLSVGEIDDTAGIQGRCSWQRHSEFGKEPLVASALLEASDLGCSGIKGVRTSAKGPSAAAALVMGFEQHHSAALSSE